LRRDERGIEGLPLRLLIVALLISLTLPAMLSVLDGTTAGMAERKAAEVAEDIARTVEEMAAAAAFQDPRFPPLRKEELKDLRVEVSVLTPLRRVNDVGEIEVGTHGLYIRRGGRGGLLLPQVATEWRWDRDTFLKETCRKAGLAPEAWKDPETEIYVFSADVFGEE
jgi:AmmeMemoRadiSam system protein A